MNPTEPSVREPATIAIKLRDDLVFTPDVSREPAGYTIEDPFRGKFYRVGVPEFTFLSLLDGNTSISEAIGIAAGKLGALRLAQKALAEHEALALCRWALDCELAHPAGADHAVRLGGLARKNARRRWLARLNPLAIQLPLCRPDRLLTGVSQRLGWFLSLRFFVLWSVVVLYALYLVAVGWSHLAQTAMVILDRDNWLRLAAAWLVLKLIHETAHGVACKKYGGSVPAAGITLILFFPLAYVDVTSSWRFRSKWQRIATAAAGMVAELFVAALAIIVWSCMSPGSSAELLRHMALNIAVTAGFATLLFNGNPLVRFDGYYILSDLLDVQNLYSCSQQYVTDCIRKHLLGHQTPIPPWPAGRGWLIRVYAPAALAWRVVFYLTLALAIAGRCSYLGGVIAVGLLGIGWGVPFFQMIHRVTQTMSCQRVNRTRVALTAVIAGAAIVWGAMLLARPGRVTAPAVVEYAPLTVIRAATGGFVRAIHVASGESVASGQLIATLENKDLQAEASDLELALRQSLLRGRVNLQGDELAKYQVETAQQQSLEDKIAQMRRRLESLLIRAPAEGRIIARDLDALPGRYLQEGAEIAVLGSEVAKELVIAIPQDDVDLFSTQQRSTADVAVRTQSGEWLDASLAKVNPRGSAELPHPALAASAGGPLAVKAVPPSRGSGEDSSQLCQLLAPVFIGKASLSPGDALRVRPGQLTTVSFRAASESTASRWYKSAQMWIAKHTSGGK